MIHVDNIELIFSPLYTDVRILLLSKYEIMNAFQSFANQTNLSFDRNVIWFQQKYIVAQLAAWAYLP